MDQDEFVIFAELDREMFDPILERLIQYFQSVRFGRQEDDWIWINFSSGKIEIDTFHSANLEVKGMRSQYADYKEILGVLEKEWIIQKFNPSKIDKTR